MKERLIGVGLTAGMLTLALGWQGPASAFSIGSTVTVENFLKNATTLKEDSFQGPVDVTVIEEIEASQTAELSEFGGIWDIDLDDHSILFTLNSKFRNVVSGDDIYRFDVVNYVGTLPSLKFDLQVTLLGPRTFNRAPVVALGADNRSLEVIFPRLFGPQDAPDLRDIDGQLGLRIDLIERPVAVPTPALLPGLVGLGLAALRRQRQNPAS
ncbi:MAG TPA: PTPA-CTERM sorting domain-containing protein [Nodosilinea sp.]|nr:PTPA-CTERM sorting domain-containing protein [Nodosilinea sp.]